MPDLLRKTVSASQAAMMFNVSPYGTPRVLYDYLHDGVDINEPENDSMEWGKFLQPFLLKRASEKLNLEVIPNQADEYIRHAELPLGCTLDAHLTCPSRGPGIVEAKAVRWQVHKEAWAPDKAPLHIELQVQQQMLVRGASWGVIACMIGANEDFIVYERRPDQKVYERLIEEAEALMLRVANDDRPAAYGHKLELRGLEKLFPEIIATKKLEDMANHVLGQMLRDFDQARTQETFYRKAKEELQPRILDMTKDAGDVRVFGAAAKIARIPVGRSVITLPPAIRSALFSAAEQLRKPIALDLTLRATLIQALEAAVKWEQETRKAYGMTKITVTEHDDGDIPDDVPSFMEA